MLNKDYPFHKLTIEECKLKLDTNLPGLTDEQVEKRLSEYGLNRLKEQEGKSYFQRFYEQFKNVMVLILLVAAIISGSLGEWADTAIIFIVVMVNAVMGVIQESKAEAALAALKEMSSPYAKIRRGGIVQKIKSEEIVPGDILILEAGDHVPADLRLIESASLKIEESSLTGESVPSEKDAQALLAEDTVLGDRINMAFMGSAVTYGRGLGIAVATGMDTQMGHIADYLSRTESQTTPLQKKLDEMGKYISIAVIALSILIFLAGLLRGREAAEMFLTSVSLAVAAIPEGLPAIVTIVLAMGVQKMARQNAIIRKLPAVETLGSTQVICSDKTGTLTQNKMTVTRVFIDENIIDSKDLKDTTWSLKMLYKILTLCNDAQITELEGQRKSVGDPTEIALIEMGITGGFTKDKLEERHPRLSEIPFDSDRKLMTSIHNIDDVPTAFTKGAPDELLKRCTHALINGTVLPITDGIRIIIHDANNTMASQALRVLAGAYKKLESIPSNPTPQAVENGLTFVGMVGMIDPPREEVKTSVNLCRSAGITPVMITGDHLVTATAIARQLNILQDGKKAITGSDLDKIDDAELNGSIEDYAVYARVSPEHKVRIVKAWKSKGKVVAMTGDGVNDAPALKTSDIGVGMGITGTDVSKGVSDMVLSDDNFATIVSAVREGRRIFSNIRKSIQFLLSANIGEVLTLFVATMLGWPILSAIHILWINLVTDTFPALALGVEKEESNSMSQKPRNSNESVFSGGIGVTMIYQGVLESLVTLGIYYYARSTFPDPLAARTMAFLTLGLIQLTHVNNIRSNNRSLLSIGIFSNIWLIIAIGFSTLLQVSVVLLPFLNEPFKVMALSPGQWLLVIIASISIVPIVEIIKFIQRITIKNTD